MNRRPGCGIVLFFNQIPRFEEFRPCQGHALTPVWSPQEALPAGAVTLLESERWCRQMLSMFICLDPGSDLLCQTTVWRFIYSRWSGRQWRKRIDHNERLLSNGTVAVAGYPAADCLPVEARYQRTRSDGIAWRLSRPWSANSGAVLSPVIRLKEA